MRHLIKKKKKVQGFKIRKKINLETWIAYKYVRKSTSSSFLKKAASSLSNPVLSRVVL